MTPSELINGKTYRIDRDGKTDVIHETGVYDGKCQKEGYLFKLSNDRMVFVNIRYVSEIDKKFETIEKIAKDYFGIVSLNTSNDMSRMLMKALSEAYDEGRWQLQEELAIEEDRIS